jgi:hypothetical protein
VIDISGISDGSSVDSVSGCGVKVTFSKTLTKQTVGAGWATWGSPPKTEDATPPVLVTTANKLVLTYSVRGRRVGVEAEPEQFGVFHMVGTFRRLDGTTIGKIARNPDGDSGALLFAGLVKSTRKADRVKTLTMKADPDAQGFAIAQIRVS